MSKLISSHSGIRGIVGGSLTPEIALRVGQAFGTYLGSGPVIVGGDTRTSYHIYKSAVVAGLLASGVDVIEIGYAPTPTCQQAIRHHSASGAVVVTASHNPIEWNGLKLMNSSGAFLNGDEHATYSKIFDQHNAPIHNWDAVGKYTYDDSAIDHHIDRIFDALDPTSIQNAKLRVIVDPNHGAACGANQQLFERLGINATILNSAPTGRFAHNPEPAQSNVSQIMDEMKSGNYDIGFVQDADADRLVILDETGRFIGEDYSLGLCIDYILQHTKDTAPSVVVNLSTSNVIGDIAKRHNAKLTMTKIGEAYVTEGLKSQNATVGGEGNGGLIFPKIGWGRDSLVGIVIALKYLAESGKSVTEIVASYPSYVMNRDKIAVSSRDEVAQVIDKVQAHFSSSPINTDDGVKVTLDDAWVHVRPSNTEPIIRIFSEAPTAEKAAELVQQVRNLL